MKKFCCKTRRMRTGFTLLEVMFTALILAVLAAVAIPLYASNKADAETKTCQSNERAIASAESKYYFEKNAYAVGAAGKLALRGQGLGDFPVCPKTNTDTFTLTDDGAGTLTIACTNHGSNTVAIHNN
jgi:prepilin-type N-terminal cleavage/methylation domain-containing protein